MTRPVERDPNLLTVREAAAFMGIKETRMRQILREDEAFRSYVTTSAAFGSWSRISRVRLERWLHGTTETGKAS